MLSHRRLGGRGCLWPGIYSASKSVPLCGHRAFAQPCTGQWPIASSLSVLQANPKQQATPQVQADRQLKSLVFASLCLPEPGIAAPEQTPACQRLPRYQHPGCAHTDRPKGPSQKYPYTRRLRQKLPNEQTHRARHGHAQPSRMSPNKTPHRESHRWGVVHDEDSDLRCV
jgi:hypothetical protein